MRTAESKLYDWNTAREQIAAWKQSGESVVMTNGTFDILHAGHVSYLEWSRQQGGRLVIGLNSDASIQRIKGDKRPLVAEAHRVTMLAGLECVDAVVVFDEDEPKNLISHLLPDILVKASDWSHFVSGRDIVEANGGEVRLAPMVDGVSTSDLIRKICNVFTGQEAQLDAQKQRDDHA